MSTFTPPPIPPAMAPGFQPEPGWIKPIGIISIVLGSLGVLGGCCSTIGSFAGPALLAKLPPENQLPPEAMPTVGTIVLSVLSLLNAVVLLIAGMFLQLKVQSATVAHQSSMGVAAPPGQEIGLFLGLGCGAIFGLAYPIFILVWFGALGKKVPDSLAPAPAA
ncbi:MAG: hypothetical protein ACOVP8_05915 [Phycisphaerales bacterium]